MKKTLIALMALAGAAFGEVQYGPTTVDSGTYTINMDAASTTKDSTLYDYLYGVFVEGGTLTLNLNINYAGGDAGAYQTLLHVGRKDTGFTIFANGKTNLIVSELHKTEAENELQASGSALKEGANTVSITLTGNAETKTAAVSFVINNTPFANAVGTDGKKDVRDLSWDTMVWDTALSYSVGDAKYDEKDTQNAKYSVNTAAPGWTKFDGNSLVKEATVTTLTSGSATFTTGTGPVIVPEPTTATLSLLALAGLAARRRRR